MQVGDTVVCRDASQSDQQLVEGQHYRVNGLLPMDGRMKPRVSLVGHDTTWWEHRFEVVKDATPIPTSDPVSSPSHYVRGGYELIDVLEAWELSPAMYSAVCYIMRAKFKGSELTDLQKARWYLDREIRKLGAK